MGRSTPKPDIAAKNFWSDPKRFAALFNAYFFGGEPVIDWQKLKERNTDVSADIPDSACSQSYEHVEKREDVTMYYEGVILTVLGIENQFKVHYAMPLRSRNYDDCDMLKECHTAEGRMQKAKGKETRAEFLSRIPKGTKLHPVFRIVIYYGEEPWDGPTKLSEMVDIPDEFRPFFSDYGMHILELHNPETLEKLQFGNKDVEDLVAYSQWVRRNEREKIKERGGNICKDTADVISSITGNRNLCRILNAAAEKGGDLNMCKALDELEKKSKAKGLAEGKAKGLAEGEAKGEAKGEARGLIKGATAKAEQIAAKMFANGFDLATVMEYTELPEGRLRALAGQAAR